VIDIHDGEDIDGDAFHGARSHSHRSNCRLSSPQVTLAANRV
jgi:hypothetical protein